MRFPRASFVAAVLLMAGLAHARAVAPPRLVETDALDPPVTRRDAASAAPAAALEALALAGTDARFGLTVLGGGEKALVRVLEEPLSGEGGRLAVECSWVLAWPQRDRIVRGPSGEMPSEVVRELLVRDARLPIPARTQDAPAGLQSPSPPLSPVAAGGLAPLLVVVRVGEDASAGLYRGRLRLEADDWSREVEIAVRVVRAMGVPAREPATLFHRGSLTRGTGLAQRGWPDVLTEDELARDLAALARLRLSHLTCYEAEVGFPRGRALRAEAGFHDLVIAGWPRPWRTFGPAEAARVEESVRRILATWPRETPPLFFLGDEPVGVEVTVMARAAALVRALGGLSAATLRSDSAGPLAGLVDVAILDATERPRAAFLEAVRATRSAGSEAWQYWQAWPESGRAVRWNAGFAQLAEPTSGQAAYCFAQADRDAWDAFDGGHADMLMAYPGPDALTPTLQLEAFDAGLEDLAVWRAAAALVESARADARQAPCVARLEEKLSRARRRWSRERSAAWGLYDPFDVAATAEGRGPAAKRLEQERQHILEALARAQDDLGGLACRAR